MTYTRPIFPVNSRYRARKAFSSGPSEFQAGEVLRFVRDTYNRYDECFVYVFQSETYNVEKEWWLGEEEPTERWHEYFEPLNV